MLPNQSLRSLYMKPKLLFIFSGKEIESKMAGKLCHFLLYRKFCFLLTPNPHPPKNLLKVDGPMVYKPKTPINKPIFLLSLAYATLNFWHTRLQWGYPAPTLLKYVKLLMLEMPSVSKTFPLNDKIHESKSMITSQFKGNIKISSSESFQP